LGGGTVDFAQWLAAGSVVLAFFKTTCPTCMLAFPFLERLHQHRAGPRLLAVSQDDVEATAGFHEEFGITMPTALDEAREGYVVSNAYGVTHVPSLFLVSATGTVEWFSTGFSKPELEELATISGVELFTAHDRVPVWKPG
jgi:peroxiredoxin